MADTQFVLFGTPHLTALALAGAAICGAYFTGRSAWGRARERVLAATIAGALLAIELWKAWYWIGYQGEPWFEQLPLHLCRIGSFLCAAMLLLKSYRIFEVAYFWGVGGSVAAMLTPDMRAGYPSADFFGFFIGHTLVLVAILFSISEYRFRPRLRSIAITAAVSGVYMCLVAGVNMIFGTNYLYLSAKPAGASLYDYLGPWPWYIVGIWAVAVVLCFICYAPFARIRRKSG